MKLSKMTLNIRDTQARKDLSDPQNLHRTVERLFSASRGTDGRLAERVLYRRDGCTVLIQSFRAVPDWAAHRVLCPGYHAEPPITKDVNPKFRAGQRWFYKCKVNTSAYRPSPDGGRWRNIGIYYAESQLEWWHESAGKFGFRVLSASTVPEKIWFSGSRSKIILAAATIEGFLEVTDVVSFEQSVRSGIGRAKAYGLGMLSLYPAT